MQVRAAIATAPGKPLTVTHVNLDGPRASEVLVEVKATGVCHTDEYTLSGADPEGIFPSILGHEAPGSWSRLAGTSPRCGPATT
jgi:S-(hydroxymethyl)glutathione dehydrogenase/alcohol dehydrogenase